MSINGISFYSNKIIYDGTQFSTHINIFSTVLEYKNHLAYCFTYNKQGNLSPPNAYVLQHKVYSLHYICFTIYSKMFISLCYIKRICHTYPIVLYAWWITSRSVISSTKKNSEIHTFHAMFFFMYREEWGWLALDLRLFGGKFHAQLFCGVFFFITKYRKKNI